MITVIYCTGADNALIHSECEALPDHGDLILAASDDGDRHYLYVMDAPFIHRRGGIEIQVRRLDREDFDKACQSLRELVR